MTPQCTRLILNANGDPARFADTGLPVIADDVPDFAGRSPASSPGSTGRRRTRRTSHMSRACRAIARSCRAIWWRGCTRRAPPPASRSPARARANGGIRWSGCGRSRCAPICARALTEEDLRKIELWTARHGVALADWPAEPVDPFFNVNTPEDAAAAERLAAQYPDA